MDRSRRLHVDEQMDDFSITDERLTGALANLRWTNRLLGGYRASDARFDPLLKQRRTLHVLDVGTGGADYLAHLVARGARFGCTVTAAGVDANPATVAYARRWLDAHLSAAHRGRVTMHVGDARALPLDDGACDVAHASLFLHHFYGDELREVLAEMDRTARLGLIVNDLHRHPIAYWGIRLLAAVLPVSSMYRHDAPASVARGFTRAELQQWARAAGLGPAHVRWHWAFRWTLATRAAAGVGVS
ncbi:methyltransferase domain-containing protein [Salisaeta longa]|uniref:methyltransferase domain-containing protein n=1 Tax=Salisaeta longa TaxID=503170 RepID=UPI0003B59F62|nr:methyltransferase domain-containing protein [Salisaeta longa]